MSPACRSLDTTFWSSVPIQSCAETTPGIASAKTEVASERIRALNPDVEIVPYALRLDSSNALEIFEPYDVVVDGTDNFPTRYLSNDACVLLGKPNVYGSIFRFEGQATVFDTRRGPCYRCLFPEPPPPGSVPSCAPRPRGRHPPRPSRRRDSRPAPCRDEHPLRRIVARRE